MNVCRICLSGDAPDRTLYHLKTSKKDGKKGYKDIMQFCLDIEVAEDSKITKKMCTKCFKKVLGFYKFKSMALKNDAYLRALVQEPCIKLEIEPIFEPEIVVEPIHTDTGTDCLKCEVKTEKEHKHEIEIIPQSLNIVKHETRLESNDDTYSDSVSSESNEDPIQAKNSEENCDIESPELHATPGSLATEVQTRSTRLKQPRKQVNQMKSKKHISNKKSMKKRDADVKPVPGVCDQCGTHVQNLKLHSIVHIPRHERQRFPCKECDKTFITSTSLKVHHKIKHLGKLGHCDICNKDFTNLKCHQLITHNREKMPMQCTVCKMRFRNQSSLDSHITRHTKEKAFQCDYCGKNFRLKLTLNQHVRSIHEKEKNFVCQHCSKSFFKKYHFINHLRTHTKEKPFQCQMCDKSFTTTTTLKDHQYSHSTVKEFHCKLCAMSFFRPGNLRTHMLSHSNEKRYPCRYCGAAFKRSGPRKKHEYDKHEKNMIPDTVDCNI